VLDEAALGRGAIWARVKITVTPLDPRGETREAELGAEICSIPDLGDSVREWSVEIHTETAPPAAPVEGAPIRRPAVAPRESYYRDLAFGSAAALTHVRTICVTMKGRRFTRAARMPAPIPVKAGDRARVEVQVHRDPRTQRVAQPLIALFEEPPRGGLAAVPRLVYEDREEKKRPTGGLAMRGTRLGAIEDTMRQAREVIDQFLRLNPSSDDKRSVDILLVECQAIYEGENIVNLPLITHVASGICFDKLISRVRDKIAKYTAVPVRPPVAPKDEGWPWWAYGLAGLGGLGAVAGVVALLAPKRPAPAAR
jgi:hypothetical protein